MRILRKCREKLLDAWRNQRWRLVALAILAALAMVSWYISHRLYRDVIVNDPFKLLDIPEHADAKTIKRAFRHMEPQLAYLWD